MEFYNSYRKYLKKRFGREVIKVPINGGFSCPNRDGTKSEKGCFFCDNISFSPVADALLLSPAEQLLKYIEKTKRKECFFLPYLQPFSNTYGSVEKLKEVYEPLLRFRDVIGIAIGTRPDCFNEEIYNYLHQLSNRTYVSIELGLQSIHNSTLQLCNRGHTFEDFVDAVNRLSKIGIECVVHVILGLPQETEEMMIETAKRLSELPCSGVKIHQLMIIKGTEFEKWYNEGRIKVFEIEEYSKILSNFISFLRPDQHIHRIMSDSTPEKGLIAPMWSVEKNKSILSIHNYMKYNKIIQGKSCVLTTSYLKSRFF